MCSKTNLTHHHKRNAYQKPPQRDTTSHPLGWLKSKRQVTTSIRETVEKSETSYTAAVNIKCYSHFGERFGSPLKSYT